MINLVYTAKNIFESEEYSVIVHACSCNGLWGAGIAKQMKKLYPPHYREYATICQKEDIAKLIGGSLIIYKNNDKNKMYKNHFIACLFTNIDAGSRNPSQNSIEYILDYTKNSILSLIILIEDYKNEKYEIKEIHMPKINSGYFGVPWKQTEEIIKNIKTEKDYTIYVHIL